MAVTTGSQTAEQRARMMDNCWAGMMVAIKVELWAHLLERQMVVWLES